MYIYLYKYVYIYICMYIDMYVYTYIYTYTYTYIPTYTQRHTHLRAHTYTHPHIDNTKPTHTHKVSKTVRLVLTLCARRQMIVPRPDDCATLYPSPRHLHAQLLRHEHQNMHRQTHKTHAPAVIERRLGAQEGPDEIEKRRGRKGGISSIRYSTGGLHNPQHTHTSHTTAANISTSKRNVCSCLLPTTGARAGQLYNIYSQYNKILITSAATRNFSVNRNFEAHSRNEIQTCCKMRCMRICISHHLSVRFCICEMLYL